MKRHDFPRLVCLLCLVLCCCACANGDGGNVNATGATAPDAMSVATPVPTPQPTAVPPPQASTVEETFLENLYSVPLEVDLAAAIETMELPERPLFSDILAHQDDWSALSLQYHLAMTSACEDAVMRLEDHFPDIVLEYDSDIRILNWKYAGSVLWAVGDGFSAWELFEADCSVEILDDGAYRLHVQIGPMDFQPFLYELAGSDRDLYMDARYIMAYLTTVFDEEGAETEYVMPALPEEYVVTIQKPLERASYYDSWYQGRSNNTRKHTGIDLRASANSEIRSCTDGTVLYIGYQAIPGNYVVILDDQGYEYHYYHMIRQTDFLQEGQRVSAGDLIGHVGNTGNSAVNHLHLALITPDCMFVKLYELMNTLYSR